MTHKFKVGDIVRCPIDREDDAYPWPGWNGTMSRMVGKDMKIVSLVHDDRAPAYRCGINADDTFTWKESWLELIASHKPSGKRYRIDEQIFYDSETAAMARDSVGYSSLLKQAIRAYDDVTGTIDGDVLESIHNQVCEGWKRKIENASPEFAEATSTGVRQELKDNRTVWTSDRRVQGDVIAALHKYFSACEAPASIDALKFANGPEYLRAKDTGELRAFLLTGVRARVHENGQVLEFYSI